MAKGFFVTGTGTDVGKTVVTSILLKYMLNHGIDIIPVKPIQTGCISEGTVLSVPDLNTLTDISGYTIKTSNFINHNIYKYRHACSPHLAADLENNEISIDHLKNRIDELGKEHQYLIVEGAGGVMVPINHRNLMIDFISLTNLPVIIVIPAELGAINHSLLTISKLKEVSITIAGVIFTRTHKETEDDRYICKDNIEIIKEFSGINVIGEIPYIADFKDRDNLQRIIDLLSPNLDKIIEEYLLEN